VTDAHGPFEQGEGPVQVAFEERQQTEPITGPHEATRVSNRLGNLQSFGPEGTPLSERAQLGMAHSKPGTGDHGG
jgi:hypothetical protein